ncbi:type II secretion system F family protein [Vibrio pectenicida]|uniref:type II secretion system F family protein n=1 Tax=Vibrio pectenicida TaxID=62763 RepID=UPI003B9AF692
MIFYLALIWASAIGFIIIIFRKNNRLIDEIIEFGSDDESIEDVKSIINSYHFDKTLKGRVRQKLKRFVSVFRPNLYKKIVAFIVTSFIVTYIIKSLILDLSYLFSLIIITPILFVLFYFKLKQLQEQSFKQNFPDALTILGGAMSAGQSIVHAFEYVGNQLDNEVGREFKTMSERLLIGEDADDVLERSSNRFPYLEYFFFISTIRINLSRGGQLKEVINKINRIMFESRATEKKKNALTSEARSSAKIVACLPVIFIFILKFTSPENYDFVMFQDGGKPIFYYVLISESIGFFIIWLILKSVE